MIFISDTTVARVVHPSRVEATPREEETSPLTSATYFGNQHKRLQGLRAAALAAGKARNHGEWVSTNLEPVLVKYADHVTREDMEAVLTPAEYASFAGTSQSR